jgi:hypothetical protein
MNENKYDGKYVLISDGNKNVVSELEALARVHKLEIDVQAALNHELLYHIFQIEVHTERDA